MTKLPASDIEAGAGNAGSTLVLDGDLKWIPANGPYELELDLSGDPEIRGIEGWNPRREEGAV